MNSTLTRVPKVRLSLVLLFAACFSAVASAQTFQFAPGRIPQGAPFNNSYTENVDFADVDLDGDFDAIFADGGDFGNDQNRLWINLGGAQGGTLGVFEDRTAIQLPVQPSTPAGAWSCAPRASAPIRHWPRSDGWSKTPKPARPKSSDSPIASPRYSFRWWCRLRS